MGIAGYRGSPDCTHLVRMTYLSANSLRDTYTGIFACREGSMSVTAGECPQSVPLEGCAKKSVGEVAIRATNIAWQPSTHN